MFQINSIQDGVINVSKSSEIKKYEGTMFNFDKNIVEFELIGEKLVLDMATLEVAVIVKFGKKELCAS
jgi:hypothetical protein